MSEYQHEFSTPLDAATHSMRRASEVLFEPISGAPQIDKPPPGDAMHGWPDMASRDEFAVALLTEAVRHLITHLTALELRINAISARASFTYMTQVAMQSEEAGKVQDNG